VQRAQPDKRFQAADLTLRLLTRRFLDVHYHQLLDAMPFLDRVLRYLTCEKRCGPPVWKRPRKDPIRLGDAQRRIAEARQRDARRDHRQRVFADARPSAAALEDATSNNAAWPSWILYVARSR